MGTTERIRAAETYVKAFRSGEATTALRLSTMLAADVVVTTANSEIAGHDAVMDHVTGAWPMTPALNLGGYSEPSVEADGTLVVSGQIFNLGAAPVGATLRFRFDDNDLIEGVEEQLVPGQRAEPLTTIPLLVRSIINGALAIGRPIVFCYVDREGRPNQSLRGSVVVFGPTELALWARPGSHVADELEHNPNVSLLYRDSSTRTTLIVKGTARIETDEALRRRAYELSAEVEQRHDPAMAGNAVIVSVAEIRGSTPQGGVLVQP